MTLIQCLYGFIHAKVHRTIGALGYKLVRSDRVPQATVDLLEIAVARELLKAPELFSLVQIGANDGVYADPLRKLILKWHIKGVLVEPLPDVFATLVKNYAEEKQLVFENCAIGQTDGDIKMYRLLEADNTTSVRLSGLATMDTTLARKAGRVHKNKREEVITVRTMTMASLFKKHGIRDLSLLVVDTEGADWDIIKQVLDLPARPSLLMFEHAHLTREARIESRKLLTASGYGFIETPKDTLAVLGG